MNYINFFALITITLVIFDIYAFINKKTLMEKVIGLLLTAFSIFITLYTSQATSPVPNSTETYTYNEYSTASAKEPLQEDYNSTNDNISSTEEETILISDNTFSGSIYNEGQEDHYKYVAPKTGTYRFDFNTSNVNNPFEFILVSSNGEYLTDISSSDNGKTIDLIQDETYDIYIKESSGLLNFYSVLINIPNDIVLIEGSIFSGTIAYEDQTDIFEYTAPVTGIYHFDFDYSNVNNPFHFSLYDSRKKELASCSADSLSDSEGKTISLTQGEVYNICISEASGLLDSYTVSIGIPNEPQKITENVFGGTLKYTDQKDIYYYTAPRSGIYRFDFDSSNVNNIFSFYIFDSKMVKLVSSSSYDSGKTIELNKGETYEIDICEKDGLLESYSITIGVPKKTKKIDSLLIQGDITYTDQCDKFRYTAPYSGSYTLGLDISDVNCSYKLVIIDSKNETIRTKTSSDNETTVDLVAGEIYNIQIIQRNGYPFQYSIYQK